jgi:hypothetical protein
MEPADTTRAAFQASYWFFSAASIVVVAADGLVPATYAVKRAPKG